MFLNGMFNAQSYQLIELTVRNNLWIYVNLVISCDLLWILSIIFSVFMIFLLECTPAVDLILVLKLGELLRIFGFVIRYCIVLNIVNIGNLSG